MDGNTYKIPVILTRQAGVTLLEIMITVVILSLGLLGLAGLQMTGLKNNREAYNSTIAAQVIQDISERIRADRTGNYDNVSIDAETECSKSNVVGSVAGFAARASCQLQLLPVAEARVTKFSTGTAPNAYYVAVIWSDPLLNGAFGWGTEVTGSANPDASACGGREINKRCYYTVLRP